MARELLSVEVLGTLPDAEELRRLVKNYPSYEWEHRSALLDGYFAGRTLGQLVEDKLRALGLEPRACSGHSLGGHGRWVWEKVKKTFVRILYLRYRIDGAKTRREAHQHLLQLFYSQKADDAGQSALRKMTEGAAVDE